MCKHCDGKVSIIPMNHNLRTIKDDKGNYVKVDLVSNCNKKSFEPSIIFESCASDKVSRMTIYIKYCPMCGKNIKESEDLSVL